MEISFVVADESDERCVATCSITKDDIELMELESECRAPLRFFRKALWDNAQSPQELPSWLFDSGERGVDAEEFQLQLRYKCRSRVRAMALKSRGNEAVSQSIVTTRFFHSVFEEAAFEESRICFNDVESPVDEKPAGVMGRSLCGMYEKLFA